MKKKQGATTEQSDEHKRTRNMKTKQSMTLRTLAIVAALWLACAACAQAQITRGDDGDTSNEQPQSGEDHGGNAGGETPGDPGGGPGTGGETPGEDYYDGTDLMLACSDGVATADNTFTLTKDIRIDSYINVRKNLTIDLNGHNITSNSTCFYIDNGITLKIVDSKPGGNIGSVNCNVLGGISAIEIKSGATLIADGITITYANCWAVNNDHGTVEIKDCTISGARAINNNYGTATVTGGSISGTDTAILNDGGMLSINTGEDPAACTLIGGDYGICNYDAGIITLGSSIKFSNYSVCSIVNYDGTFNFNDWPAFSAANSAGVSDIWLFPDQKITISSDISAAPMKKFCVRLTDYFENDLTADALPVTFTSGYASKVKDGSGNVIDPAEVFTYANSSLGYSFALTGEGSSAEVQFIDPNNIPDGTDVTSILSPTALGGEDPAWSFKMPGYDVTVAVEWVPLFDPVTFAFAEGQEWMTWCSEASFTLPEGIEAYTIDDATAQAITVTQITAADDAHPAVLPAFTPLLLRKKSSGGMTAEQADVPDAPNGVYDKNSGLVTRSADGAMLYGTTKALSGTDADDTFALWRTFVLKDGAFIAVDEVTGFAANRCWLTLKEKANARRLEIRTGESTEVSGVKELRPVRDDAWYSLTGRRVSKPTRGVYIHNGRKEVIK